MAKVEEAAHNASDVTGDFGELKSAAPEAGKGCQCPKCNPPAKKNGGAQSAS